MAERVSRYRDKPPLFEAYGVDAEIRSTLSRRVDLPSGGYLIFDYAEAFTVIDVNTGRFVGSRSKTSSARLEDTVTKNNLEAVKEVVRQLRLRDIGGIIVIDFIDMANPKNREAVEQALQQELERDRTKTYVVEISPLGLVEMTRQNVTDGPREILTRKCPTCAGEGIVVSEATAVVDAERQPARARRVEAAHEGVQGRAERHVAELLDRPGRGPPRGDRGAGEAAVLRRRARTGVGARPLRSPRRGHGREARGRRARPSRRARRSRSSSSRSAATTSAPGSAKLDGWLPICVGGAAKLVGKKVNVRIERVLDGIAYATARRRPRRRRPSAPITAEAQAEKPTRASRAKKPEPSAEPSRGVEAVEGGAVAEEDEDEERARCRDAAEEKTRRGSRGGRGRKKKPAVDGRSAASKCRRRAEPEAPEPAAEVPDASGRCAAEEEDAPRLARRSRPEEAGCRRRGDERRGRAGARDGRRAVRRSTCRRPKRRATNGDEPGDGGGAQEDTARLARREAPSQADGRGRRAAARQTRARTSVSAETRGPSQPIVPSCSHSSCGARISTGVMPAPAAPCSSR